MPPENTAALNEEPATLEELTSDGQGAGLEVEKAESCWKVPSAYPFDPSKIDVITQFRTVDLLLVRLREGELGPFPPNSSDALTFGIRAARAPLIESMLLRIPIPSLYVSEDEKGDYTVVDGLQRLCAIAHFVDVAALNRAVKVALNPLRLTDLQSLGSYNGSTFAELPRPLQRRISETELTLHIIRASTPEDVKFNIFSRINRGGLPLTAQEIRNAIYKGSWRDRVSELAQSPKFLVRPSTRSNKSAWKIWNWCYDLWRFTLSTTTAQTIRTWTTSSMIRSKLGVTVGVRTSGEMLKLHSTARCQLLRRYLAGLHLENIWPQSI